jgi:hypothetical protein
MMVSARADYLCGIDEWEREEKEEEAAGAQVPETAGGAGGGETAQSLLLLSLTLSLSSPLFPNAPRVSHHARYDYHSDRTKNTGDAPRRRARKPKHPPSDQKN